MQFWKTKRTCEFLKTSNSTRLSDSCYFEVFEKLTHACFALEIMLLPILIARGIFTAYKIYNCQFGYCASSHFPFSK